MAILMAESKLLGFAVVTTGIFILPIRAKNSKQRQLLPELANLMVEIQRLQGFALSQVEKNKSGGKAPHSKEVL